MLSTSRRAGARRGTRVGAIVASAAVVVTLVPALLLSAPSNAASTRAAASPVAADASVFTATGSRPQASSNGHQRRVNPSAYKAFTLDSSALDGRLSAAPDESAKGAAPATLQLPAPNGDVVTFDVVESSIMESGLAADHPEIKTYAGRSQDGSATVRFDVTPMGFHAFVRGAHGGDAWFIDPAYNGDDSLYLSYMGDALPAPERGLVEPNLDEVTGEDGLAAQIAGDTDAGENPGDAVKLRTYRLALITDPTYATYFGTANVLAEKVTLINRVNQVYNDDLAIRLRARQRHRQAQPRHRGQGHRAQRPVRRARRASRDAPTTSTPADSATALWPEPDRARPARRRRQLRHRPPRPRRQRRRHRQPRRRRRRLQGPGLHRPARARAATSSPSTTWPTRSATSSAATTPSTAPSRTARGGNRNAGTSVEPGSGSSVMAYAGICQQDNLQPHTDPYFSQRSQTEITAYIVGSRRRTSTRCRPSRCATSTPTATRSR